MRTNYVAVVLAILLSAVVAFAAPDTGVKQLFNGKDLSGWEHVGPGSFSVEDGMLRTHGGMGLLWCTKEKVGNAVLRVVYKVKTPDSNSGVFIRISDKPKDEWFAVHHGYEVQILDQGGTGDDWHSTGAIYSLSKAVAKPMKGAGEWNVLEITLDGPRTIVHLNGKKVNDFREGQPVPERKQHYEPERGPRPEFGYVGLQNHDEPSIVYFKEVSVHPLKKSAKGESGKAKAEKSVKRQ